MNGQIPFREVDLRLQNCQMVWLTTTSDEGYPHCVPILFWWESATRSLFFTSSPRAAKARHLSREPHVILHTGEGSDTIILEGTTRTINQESERQRINTAWQTKYADTAPGTDCLNRSTQLYQVQIMQVIVREYDPGNSRTHEQFESMPVSV